MPNVSIVKCRDYNSGNLTGAVHEALMLLGGIENFVKKNGNVLIKPNLLSAREPEEAVCTHPEFCRAVIRLVKEAGGRPLIGDSPGNFFTIADVDSVYEKSGIKRIAKEENAELIRFTRSSVIKGVPIAQAALDADVIISLPKLKTHSLTMMTGAVKNTFGMVTGLYKVECHRRNPKPKDFVKILLDVYEITRPCLSIMDAILAMEGDGPAAGNPKYAGIVLASSDGVSMDRVVSELVGLPPSVDIIINEAKKRGEGGSNIHNIRILGESIENAKLKGFKLPKTSKRVSLLPDFLANLLMKSIDFKPVIDEELCKKCNVCKNSCPAGAITINKGTSHIDDRPCVRCFCCSEVCPYKAIYIKRNFIASLLWRN